MAKPKITTQATAAAPKNEYLQPGEYIIHNWKTITPELINLVIKQWESERSKINIIASCLITSLTPTGDDSDKLDAWLLAQIIDDMTVSITNTRAIKTMFGLHPEWASHE